MKVYSQLPEIVAGLEKHGHSVRMPEPGGGGVGVDFKRRMIGPAIAEKAKKQ